MWDIATKTIKAQFTGHDQDIYSLDFSKSGRQIASGSGDRTVRVWDIETGQATFTLSIEDGVTTVAMSPDGRYVAAGSLDKSVRVWDCSNGYLVERLEGPDGHKDSVYSVAFAPNGRDLVSGSLDKTIKLWELSPPRGMLPGTGPKGGSCVRTFEGHKDFVLSVALTPDGQWVMSGSKDRGVQFWDPHTGCAQLMLQGHKNSGKSHSDRDEARSKRSWRWLTTASTQQSFPSRPAREATSSPRGAAIYEHASGATHPITAERRCSNASGHVAQSGRRGVGMGCQGSSGQP